MEERANRALIPLAAGGTATAGTGTPLPEARSAIIIPVKRSQTWNHIHTNETASPARRSGGGFKAESGLQEFPGVRVVRPRENLFGRPLLDNVAASHDHQVIGNRAHHA